MKKAFFLLFLILGTISLVKAQSQTLTISPAKIELQGKAGETKKFTIKVKNESDYPIDIKGEILNFVKIGATHKFFKNPEEDPTHALSNWIKTDPLNFTLKKGEVKIINVQINIPENALSGKRSAIVAFETLPQKQKDGVIRIGAKTGTTVYLEVEGKRKTILGYEKNKLGSKWNLILIFGGILILLLIYLGFKRKRK